MLSAIQTIIPGHAPIELIAYYEQFRAYYPECELQTKRWFVEHVEPDWVMFDAGANIGYYSILFSRLAQNGRTYAFEPTETIAMLRANLAHNGCRNVTPLEIALGDVSGDKEDDVYRIWGEDPERRIFHFRTVDDVARDLQLDRLDCIKIDVDSYDLDVLKGARQVMHRFNPWIVVELNDGLLKRNQSVRQALEWMYSQGYRRTHVTDAENHIFRLSENEESISSTAPSLVVSFDNQPLIVPPSVSKKEALSGFFDVKPVRHNAGSIERVSDGDETFWNVDIPGPQWAYAAAWPVGKQQLPPCEVAVEVVLQASGGTVGIGCLDVAGEHYVSEEVLTKSLRARQKITLAVPKGDALGSLMLRNADSDNATATLSLYSIEVSTLEPRKPDDRNNASAQKRRIAIEECRAMLGGSIGEDGSASQEFLDVVPVGQLGSALGFKKAFVPEILVYRHDLADFQTELDEAAFYTYIYKERRPTRMLEIGEGTPWGAALCRQVSGSEVEVAQNYPATKRFSPGSFDCVVVVGDKSPSIMAERSEAALALTAAGGLILWHGFCPDAEAIDRNPVCRTVLASFVREFTRSKPLLKRRFWIQPSWILLGVRE